MTNGGQSARKGFDYQDCAAAYYFIKDERVNHLRIEEKSDFAIFFPSKDPPQKHYYQAKASETGPFGWTKFRKTIPEFIEIATDEFDGETIIRFHLVTNHKPNSSTKDFIEDAKKVSEDIMGWVAFQARYKRELDQIEDEIDKNTGINPTDDLLSVLIPSISFSFHSRAELVSKIKNILKHNHMGRYSNAFDTILNEIRSTPQGVINRSEVENKIGFDLEVPSGNNTSSSIDVGELREEVENIGDKYSSNADSIDVASPLTDWETVENLADYEAEESNESKAIVEGFRANIHEEFEKIEQARRKEREASMAISSDIKDLLSTTDSTNSEQETENEFVETGDSE